MALAFTLVDTWDDGKRIHVAGTVAASGSYSTSGDTLDLSQAPLVASTQAPIQGAAWMDGLSGYDYVFYPGSAMNNGKVKVFQQGSGAGSVPESSRPARTPAGSAPTRSHSTESSRNCSKCTLNSRGSHTRCQARRETDLDQPMLSAQHPRADTMSIESVLNAFARL